MTLVSNDASWWPFISSYRISSYFMVASSAGVMYDWVLTFGQEVELVWRQRWSLVTALYLILRYLGIGFVVIGIPLNLPTIPVTDIVSIHECLSFQTTELLCRVVSRIIYNARGWVYEVVGVMFGIIMIVRLHAMYQRARKVLIFLAAISLAIEIASAAMLPMITIQTSGEELVLSGTYQCMVSYEGDSSFLVSMIWILAIVWEVIAMCLAVWVAVRHFRELRRHSTGGIIEDCFTVLMQTHVSYFASFLAVSCFKISLFFPTLSVDTHSLDTQIYYGFTQIFQSVQICVLGPRLILSIREYHAKLVANPDTATAMTSIAFQERVHVSTSNSV
ncbi:hypothetical protein BDR03DRAFT_1093451 [Suillus americanus]|nr:hypothetical protein BDR03DRAFT_1093451 [Suillus americanus]